MAGGAMGMGMGCGAARICIPDGRGLSAAPCFRMVHHGVRHAQLAVLLIRDAVDLEHIPAGA